MNRKGLALLLSGAAMGLAVHAGAMEVTIYDGEGYSGFGIAGEDQETEPGMVNSQRWDLEGFFVDDTDLSMVGGYDFFGGTAEYGAYTSGDIFIAIDETPLFGQDATRASNGITGVSNSYGYDYVFDVDWSDGSYNLYQIGENTQVSTGYYGSNEGSSPFEYVSGATSGSLASGFVTETNGLSDAETGFQGGNHNRISGLDLSVIYASLAADVTLYSHFTMGCGNDNLMGSWEYSEVPEPATVGLLTMGIAGIWLSRRKTRKS